MTCLSGIIGLVRGLLPYHFAVSEKLDCPCPCGPSKEILALHIGNIIIVVPPLFRPSLHIATALVVSFFGERTVELSVFHFTTALVHRFARHATDRLLCCAAERRSREHDQNKTKA